MSNELSDKLSAELRVVDNEESAKAIMELPPAEKKKAEDAVAVTDDYNYSRDTYKNLIDTGMKSLDVLTKVAIDTEHPRAFEVLSKSIKDIADTTDKLMDLQKSKKELEGDSKSKKSGDKVTNNVFFGSTTELNKLLGKQNEKLVKGETFDGD